MPADAPELAVKPARRSIWERASVVWLVPLAALVVALGVAVQTYLERGPLLLISLDEALGIKAQETELRYRDVAVGRVEDVRFANGLGRVEVAIRLDKSVAPYVDNDAQFWVVRPRVTAQGVSGLDTVLSGVFIEGVWDGEAEGFTAEHAALADAPLLRPGEDGLTFTLRGQQGTALTEGTAILHRGIEVGRVGKPELVPSGLFSQAPAVIYAPYDRLVSSTTRFWDTSGFRFSIGATGANLDFSSIASLITGGVAFDTVVSGGVPLSGEVSFDLFASEETARNSLFAESQGPGVQFSVVFDENASGLAIGAPVELRGIEIGEVTAVSGLLDPLRFRDRRVRLLVHATLQPGALGLPDGTTAEEVEDFIDEQIATGLRARLASASILTGGLKIELADEAQPGEDRLDRSADPFPVIPAVPSQLNQGAASAQGVLERVSALPIEELMASAIRFLNDAAALVRDGELAQIPGDVRAVLGDVRAVTGSDAVQALPGDLSVLMEALGAATGDLRVLAQQLEEAGAVERLLTAVDSTGAAADAVVGSVDGVPALIQSLTETADVARSLPLEALVRQAAEAVTRANDVVASVDAILAQEAAQALPDALRGTLEELRGLAAGIAEAETVTRLTAAVDSASAAADAVTESVSGVPALVDSLTATADTARALPLDALAAEARTLLDGAGDAVVSLNALLDQDTTRGLPGEVAATLADLRAIVTQIEEARSVERLLEAVDGAAEAANAVTRSVAGVPELVASLNATAETARNLPLEALVTRATSAVESAEAILSEPGARDLPATLNGALDALRLTLTDLREGGAVEALNATLASAGEAAQAVEDAARSLPQVSQRLNAVLLQASTTLGAYDANSEVLRGVRGVLTEVGRAAKAIDSLARSIERRPNSILLGR